MDEPVGRAKGGKARAESLTPERRSDIAKKGNQARRALAALPKATHGAADHPLNLGGIEIPCYVLEDERRVLSLRGLHAGIGIAIGGDGPGGEARIVSFIRGLEQKGLDTKGLTARLKNPIQFQPPGGGRSAYGYEATILADICDAVLAARKEGYLTPSQAKIAEQCEVLVRGFARVGIIALVDEVTGFQRDRDRNNLAKILEAFVAKEIQPYVKTFPSEYYEELFRLYNLPYPPAGNKSWRPQFFGMITNEVVYARLAPNLIPELKKVVSKAEKKALMHSALTQDIGHPKLREHLASIVAIQKLSKTPKEFIANVDRVHVKYGQNLPLFDLTGDAAKGATASLPPPPSEPEQPV